MKITLRKYQEEAINSAAKAIASGKKKILVVAPTASGKSILIGGIAGRAAQRKNSRILVLTAQEHLLRQNEEKLNLMFPEVTTGIFCAGAGRKETDKQVIFASRDSLGRNPEICGQFDGILIDEAHQVAVDLDKSETMYARILAAQSPKWVIGTTGTPWRLNGGRIWGEGKFFEHIAYNIPMAVLRKEGFLVPYIFPKVDTLISTENCRTSSTGDFVIKDLEEVSATRDVVEACVAEWMRLAPDRKCTLFFCVSRAHARLTHEVLQKYHPASMCAYIDGEVTDRDDMFELARAGRIKAIANVGVLTTGWDCPICDCIVFMRPTQSASLFVQCLDLKTEILTKRGWIGFQDVNESDICVAFDIDTGTRVNAQIIEKVSRNIQPDECFVEISSRRQNFRVTDGHRMVMRTSKDRPWELRTAKECASLKDGWLIPVSCSSDFKEENLTDDEIRFIGWVVSDGTIGKYNVTIFQGKPQHLDEIEGLVSRLDFRCGRYNIEKKSNFKRNHDVHRWTISYANPRRLTERHMRGCEHLRPYLSKDLPFDSFSERQFDILMETLIKADGCVLVNPVDGRGNTFKQKSFRICKSVRYIDRLQELCVVNGWRADIVEFRRNGKKTDRENATNSILSVSKTSSKTVGGCGQHDRDCAHETPSTAEMVWCVENTAGTLITRRDGKVTLMGNCAGRGLRIHPESNKKDCLILDFTDNFERFGTIEHPMAKQAGGPRFFDKKEPEEGEDPKEVEKRFRTCPACGYTEAGRTECPFCGEIFIKHGNSPFSGKKSEIWVLVNEPYSEPYLTKKQEQCMRVVYPLSNGTKACEYFMIGRGDWIRRSYEKRMAMIFKGGCTAVLGKVSGQLIEVEKLIFSEEEIDMSRVAKKSGVVFRELTQR